MSQANKRNNTPGAPSPSVTAVTPRLPDVWELALIADAYGREADKIDAAPAEARSNAGGKRSEVDKDSALSATRTTESAAIDLLLSLPATDLRGAAAQLAYAWNLTETWHQHQAVLMQTVLASVGPIVMRAAGLEPATLTAFDLPADLRRNLWSERGSAEPLATTTPGELDAGLIQIRNGFDREAETDATVSTAPLLLALEMEPPLISITSTAALLGHLVGSEAQMDTTDLNPLVELLEGASATLRDCWSRLLPVLRKPEAPIHAEPSCRRPIRVAANETRNLPDFDAEYLADRLRGVRAALLAFTYDPDTPAHIAAALHLLRDAITSVAEDLRPSPVVRRSA